MQFPWQTKKEASFGVPEEKPIINKAKVAVISITERDWGNQISKSFASQVAVYNADPILHEGVEQMAQQIISTGTFEEFNELYTVKLPNPNKSGKEWTAVEAIKYFNKVNNMDATVLNIAIHLQAFGNCIYQITDAGLQYVPIESIEKAIPVSKNVPIREKYHIKITESYGGKTLEWGTFIHFHTSPVGNGVWGTGVVTLLITRPATDVLSMWESKNKMKQAMVIGFSKFGMGNLFVGFDGLDDATFAKYQELLAKISPYGNIIVTNTPVDAKTGVVERATGFESFQEQERNSYLMSIGNISLKLGLESGFTKATAEAAVKLYESKIESFRRIIKRGIEPIWATVLNKLGFDSEEADIRMRFGITVKPEYVVSDLFTAVDKGLMSRKACTNILRKSLGWEIPSDDKPDVPEDKPVGDGN